MHVPSYSVPKGRYLIQYTRRVLFGNIYQVRPYRNQENFNLNVILSKYGEALQVDGYLNKPVLVILYWSFIKGCKEMSVFEI